MSGKRGSCKELPLHSGCDGCGRGWTKDRRPIKITIEFEPSERKEKTEVTYCSLACFPIIEKAFEKIHYGCYAPKDKEQEVSSGTIQN